MGIFTCGMPLPFSACENFRELGGYLGFDGKRVKQGVFFRTPALANLKTPEDFARFEALGVRTIFDFRSVAECDAAPDPVFAGVRQERISAIVDENGNEVNFDLSKIFEAGKDGIAAMQQSVVNDYVRLPFANPAYRAMFAAIAAQEVPLLFHCTAGKDRTGIAAALILRALGVSRADVLEDFMRTNTCRASGFSDLVALLESHMPAEEAHRMAQLVGGVQAENLTRAMDAIDARYPDYADYLTQECCFDRDAQGAFCAWALV